MKLFLCALLMMGTPALADGQKSKDQGGAIKSEPRGQVTRKEPGKKDKAYTDGSTNEGAALGGLAGAASCNVVGGCF